MADLVHISSLLIQVRPARLASVSAVLEIWPGLEVHAADLSGRLVVTLESVGERAIVEFLDRIHAEPGVLSANLVYHHIESAASLAQEAAHDADPA